jgi:heterogeneous nuclear ribonucleoprotein R
MLNVLQLLQPLLYAPGAPPGAAMVPMLLPDGRLVYVV